MSLLIFIIVLSLLVFIHELGHFLACKKNGILVEEFGIGFPPRVFGVKKGETLYSINAIPIGGFVKPYGEEYHEGEKIKENLKNRAFVNKKPWQKAVVLVAGVFMNLMLGVFIYYGLLSTNNFQSEPLPLINNYDFPFGNEQTNVLIAGTLEGSTAEEAGAEFGDVIYRVKNSNQQDWITISSAEQIIDFINNAERQEVLLDIRNVRNNEERVIEVIPEINEEIGRAVIGVSLIDAVTIEYNTVLQRIFSGFMHSYNVMAYNFSTLGSLIGLAFQERDIGPVSQSVAGPVGIFSLVSEITQSSGDKLARNLLDFVALLSLSLAFMNILPVPALDGGRLVLVAYEWLAKKPVNPEIERKLNLGGFILLISLIVLITFNDIWRLITNL